MDPIMATIVAAVITAIAIIVAALITRGKQESEPGYYEPGGVLEEDEELEPGYYF